MVIRRATLDDINKIKYLQQELINEHAKLYDSVFYSMQENSADEWLSWATKKLSSREVAIFVAEKDSKMVGYVSGWIEVRAPIYSLRKVGYLSNIYVQQQFRGQGIGSTLNSAMLDWFKKQNVGFVELNVDSRAKGAVESWLKLGYAEVGKRMRTRLD